MMAIRSILAAGVLALLPVIAAAQPPASGVVDLTPQFRSLALPIANLRVVEVGDIVLIRGTATDRAAAEQIGVIVQSLGYTRVANLVQIATAADDAAIRRTAEQRLLQDNALDGCKFRVASQNGVVHVTGKIAQDIQKDEIVMILRTIDGVRSVETDLTR